MIYYIFDSLKYFFPNKTVAFLGHFVQFYVHITCFEGSHENNYEMTLVTC